jgi:hypothetical protein
MSMLLPCDTMLMKNLLSVTLKFLNGGAQLQAAARPIIILKKNDMYSNMEEMDPFFM